MCVRTREGGGGGEEEEEEAGGGGGSALITRTPYLGYGETSIYVCVHRQI